MLRRFLHAFSFKRREWVYYSLAIAVAASATVALVFDKAKPVENPAGLKQIGTLQSEGSDVKRKFFSELEFQEIAKKDNVFLKDTIFVGPDSKVNLALGEYGDFELSPNSVLLVYLDFETKSGASSAAATNSTVGSSLKLKLTQGEIKYKKPVRQAGDQKPTKTVAIEIADNTFLKLDEQDELKVERTKAGEITVHEATVAPLVEKLPEPTAVAVSPVAVQAGESAAAIAAAPPQIEHFELKVGESFIESEIKLHANLIPAPRSPATIEEAVPPQPEPPSSNEIVDVKGKALPEPVKQSPKKVRVTAVVVEEKPKEELAPEPKIEATTPQVAHQETDSIQKPQRQGFYIGPMSYEMVSLGATDSQNLNVTTTSNYVLGAGVGYVFGLSDTSTLSVNAKIKRYQFSNFSSVTLSDNNPTTLAFDASYEKQTSQNLSLNATAGLEEILNLEPRSATQIDLKQLLSPKIGIGASYQMGDSSKWFKGFEIKANVDALLPAKGDTYTTKVGHKEQLKFLTVKDSSEGSRFSGGFTAYQQKFSTPFSETTQIGFGIEFSIGLEAAIKKRPDKELVESEGTK